MDSTKLNVNSRFIVNRDLSVLSKPEKTFRTSKYTCLSNSLTCNYIYQKGHHGNDQNLHIISYRRLENREKQALSNYDYLTLSNPTCKS